jgi:hypothetical protein
MRSLIVLAVLAGSAVAADDAPPAKKELFAKEDWYKGEKGKEQDFVGTLQKVDGGGGVGFGRFNPYRLEMMVEVTVEVPVEVDGKTVIKKEKRTEKQTREVYVGGKPELLKDYVGKKVKLVGKAVDMEVEGTQHHEIWPARVELVTEAKKDKEK